MLGTTDNVFIIAGGPSAKQHDLTKLYDLGCVLGVNDSAINAPCHAAYSMDRLWWENRWESLVYTQITCYVRHTVYDRWVSENKPRYNVHRVEALYDKTTLSLEPGIIHGNNSGFGAFNLTVQFRPKKIFLFGFDFCGEGTKAHWYEPYEWAKNEKPNKYKRWASDMDIAYPVCLGLGIEVYNCSNQSFIKDIPTITFKEVLCNI